MTAQVTSPANQQLQKAEIALQQNKLDEAEAIYKQLLSTNFLPGVMHYRLGMIANQRGDFDLALKEHREAFRLDPALANKILPEGSSLQKWICPENFDTTETTQCSICGSKKNKIVNIVNCLPASSYHTAIDPIRIWLECSDCSHVYPKFRPSDAVLKQVYSEPPPMHLQVWNYNQLALFSDILYQLKKFKAKGKFLDVGAAAGVLASEARDYGYQSIALDIHPIYKESFQRLGLDFVHDDFCNHDFGKEKFDIVAFGDVLEHMLNVEKAFSLLEKILNKDGIAWISTPNYDCTWTRAVGKNDPMWLESEHLQYFSKASFEKLIQKHGFKIIDYRVSKRYQGSVEFIIARS